MKTNILMDPSWSKVNQIYVKGSAFYQNKLLRSQDIAELLDLTTFSNIEKIIRNFNGFFSIVGIKDKKVFVISDRLRTIPCFFKIANNTELYISSSPYSLIQSSESQKPNDPIAQIDCFFAGYATGDRTLLKDIKQTQAGELIIFQEKSSGDAHITITPISKRYYDHTWNKNPWCHPEKVLLEKQEKMLIHITERLIAYANGRQIVIPLSGGYDSRIIALMLKKLKYKNIIAFSYGKSKNSESEISKYISKKLGIKWLFIPYTLKHWHDWFRSDEMREYQKTADNLSTIMHIQDWPAIWELKKQNLIEKNAVFVPGLSGDLPTGGFTKKYPHIYKSIHLNQNLLINSLIDYQSLWFYPKNWNLMKAILKKNILFSLNDLSKYHSTASAFESWVTTERVGKYINNSVKAYEFWGYDWWLPLWDNEFIGFWQNIPLSFKIEQNLYIKGINKLYSDLTKDTQDNRSLRGDKNILKKILKKILGNNEFLKMIYLYIYREKRYDDFMQFYGILKKSTFDTYALRSKNILSYLVLRRLGYINFNNETKHPSLKQIIKQLNRNYTTHE